MRHNPEEILMEEAVSAYRGRTASGRILPSPAWQDLTPESRERLFKGNFRAALSSALCLPAA